MAGYDQSLNNLIQFSVDQLKKDPSNERLRTEIFQNQILLTSKQLGTTTQQTAKLVRAYTAAYAYSKGYDPKTLMDALNEDQQQILDYNKNKPTLYGMDLVTANKVASYFAASAGIVLALSIVAFAIALFMIGPEAAAAVAAAGGVVEAITAITGVALGSTGGGALAIGSFLFLVSQFLGHMSSSIPLWTKQMIDNGTISQTMQIQAIKNVAEVQAQLSGTKAPGPYDSQQFSSLLNGLQAAGYTQVKNPVDNTVAPLSTQTLAGLINYLYGTRVGQGLPATASKITPLLNDWLLKGGSAVQFPLSLYDQVHNTTPAPVVSSNAGSASRAAAPSAVSSNTAVSAAPATNLKIFTGVISGGTLGLPQEFVASPSAMIGSLDELVSSAKVNLAAAVQSLPGRFYYEIAVVNSITTKSGFTQKGAPVSVVVGYNKNGSPKTKTLYYKFAVMKLGVTDEAGRSVKLATINLGPVDVTKFSPSNVQLNDVQQSIAGSSFTSDVGAIKNVVSATPPSVSSVPPPNPNPPQTTPTAPSGGSASRYDSAIVPERAGAIVLNNVRYAAGQAIPGNLITDSLAADLVALGGTVTKLSGSNAPSGGSSGGGGSTSGAVTQNTTGLYQYESSDVPGGVELIYYPPGKIPNPSLRAPNTPPPSPTRPADTSAPKAPKNPTAQAASSLSSFYAALGLPFPSITARAIFYEVYGLGPAGTYVGSAEQNNKLLGMLKVTYA